MQATAHYSDLNFTFLLKYNDILYLMCVILSIAAILKCAFVAVDVDDYDVDVAYRSRALPWRVLSCIY